MGMATVLIDHIAPVPFNDENVSVKKQRFFDNDGTQRHGDPKQLLGRALRHRVENIDHEYCEPGDEDTFFVAVLGVVFRLLLCWLRFLFWVLPFYGEFFYPSNSYFYNSFTALTGGSKAVKCNPDPKVLRLLSELGTGFDCASKAEIEQVLNMGVDPTRIIYAQPCKTNSYVRYVAARGVRQMTFDNADELHKIAKLFPKAELFLRILTDDSSSLCRLSLKFGASLDTTDGLLALASELGLNVVGVSFHVGSGASDPFSFPQGRAGRASRFPAGSHVWVRSEDAGCWWWVLLCCLFRGFGWGVSFCSRCV